MLGYKIMIGIVSVLWILGMISVLRHPKRYGRGLLFSVSFFLFVTYLFPLLETATNYPKGHPVLLAFLPTYNVIPLLFFLTLLASVLPFEKIRRFLWLTVSLLPFPLLLNAFATLFYHAQNTAYFNERTAVYVLGQMGLSLFGFWLIRNREVPLRISGILASVVFTLGLYGGIALVNTKCGTSVFGLTTAGGYLLLPSILKAAPSILLAANFAFIALSMCMTAALYAVFLKKEAPKDA